MNELTLSFQLTKIFYQTKTTKPSLPNRTYQTYQGKPTKPNLLDETYQAKHAKSNLQGLRIGYMIFQIGDLVKVMPGSSVPLAMF